LSVLQQEDDTEEDAMRKLLVAAIAMVALHTVPALAATAAKLGKVHLETSCTPAAQKLFDQGMLFLVSRLKAEVRGSSQGGPELRHGVLGHRAESPL
jgi:hypothetical protein